MVCADISSENSEVMMSVNTEVCYCELLGVRVASTVVMHHCGPPNGCSGPVGGALKV